MASAGYSKPKPKSAKIKSWWKTICGFVCIVTMATVVLFYFFQGKKWNVFGMTCVREEEKIKPSSASVWLWRLFSSSDKASPEKGTSDNRLATSLCGYIDSLEWLGSSLSRHIKFCVGTLSHISQLLFVWSAFTVTAICHTLQNQVVALHSSLYIVLVTLLALITLTVTYLCIKRSRRKSVDNKQTDQEEDLDGLSDFSLDISQASTPDSSINHSLVSRTGNSLKPPNSGARYKILSTDGVLKNLLRWMVTLLTAALALSIPWEFLRLYHKAVAARTATVLKGAPQECDPQTMTFLANLRSFLQAQFSWSRDPDPCLNYHYALLVDPVWELNPLLVVSSVITQSILHPVEMLSSSLGKAVRAFFSEIPLQWQPVLMLVAVATTLFLALTVTRYRLVIPMLFRLEPKTPVASPEDKRDDNTGRLSYLKSQCDGASQNFLYDQLQRKLRDNCKSNDGGFHDKLYDAQQDVFFRRTDPAGRDSRKLVSSQPLYSSVHRNRDLVRAGGQYTQIKSTPVSEVNNMNLMFTTDTTQDWSKEKTDCTLGHSDRNRSEYASLTRDHLNNLKTSSRSLLSELDAGNLAGRNLQTKKHTQVSRASRKFSKQEKENSGDMQARKSRLTNLRKIKSQQGRGKVRDVTWSARAEGISDSD